MSDQDIDNYNFIPVPQIRILPRIANRVRYLKAVQPPDLYTGFENDLQSMRTGFEVDERGNIAAKYVTLIDGGTGKTSAVISPLRISQSGYGAQVVQNYNFLAKKNTAQWEPVWEATQTTALIDGATGATLLAAGTGKYRVFGVLVSNGTAGKFAIGELNIAGLVPANTPIWIPLDNGILQNTTATAITITGAGAPATLNCTILSDDGSN